VTKALFEGLCGLMPNTPNPPRPRRTVGYLAGRKIYTFLLRTIPSGPPAKRLPPQTGALFLAAHAHPATSGGLCWPAFITSKRGRLLHRKNLQSRAGRLRGAGRAYVASRTGPSAGIFPRSLRFPGSGRGSAADHEALATGWLNARPLPSSGPYGVGGLGLMTR